jgi:hypothetical protein
VSLSFSGPRGGFERRWIVYALFRDNVQHHLEDGTPSAEYGAIHGLGDALGGDANGVEIDAVAVHEQVTRARATLGPLPISALAMSIRTRAVLTVSFPLPEHRGTALVSHLGWVVPFPIDNAKTLGDVFGSFMDELLKVTEGAKPGDLLRVIDSLYGRAAARRHAPRSPPAARGG